MSANPTVRQTLLVPFAGLLAVTAMLIGTLSLESGRRSAKELARKLAREATGRVEAEVRQFLQVPHHANAATVAVMGQASDPKPRNYRAFYWQAMADFPTVNVVGFGHVAGEYAGIVRDRRGATLTYYYEYADPTETTDFVIWELDRKGRDRRLFSRTPNYVLAKRPWYQRAVASAGPTWSDVFLSVGKQEKSLVGIAALRAHRPDGKLVGVAISYITLDRISEFLRTLTVSPQSRLFVMEPNGLLIGASTAEPLFFLKDGQMTRQAAASHPQPAIAAAAAAIQQEFGTALTGTEERTLTIAGATHWLTVTPYRDELGLVWWIGVVSPAADFMAPVRANAWRAAGLGTGALAVAILLALAIANRIVQPLLRLDRATQKLVKDLHDGTVELPPPPPVRELAALTQTFGTMAGQVQAAFQALATANAELEDRVAARTAELAQANVQIQALNEALTRENLDMKTELAITRRLQQMILPSPTELAAIAALDIAAYMEPATQVGGDYYDVFAHGQGTRICIGDVTGHGLESGVIAIMVQSAMRALSTLNLDPPTEAILALNRAIYQNVQRMHSDKSLSFLLLDYQNGCLMVTGQHETAIVLRADGGTETVDTLDLGFPIGLEEEIGPYLSQCRIPLTLGDVVLLYTDGIPEAEDGNRQLYGTERMVAVAQRHRDAPAGDIVRAITEDVYRFIGDGPIYDDITLVVAKPK